MENFLNGKLKPSEAFDVNSIGKFLAFADIFKEYKYDFYQIDKMLFSPAKVIVSSLKTGKSYTSGNIDLSLMDNSFNK